LKLKLELRFEEGLKLKLKSELKKGKSSRHWRSVGR
jgi:hypothetical protein